MTQPKPILTENSKSVFDSILERIEPIDLGPPQPIDAEMLTEASDCVIETLKLLGVFDGVKFRAMVEKRRDRGLETYGTTLMTHNGRDAIEDAIEELADAFIYLWQARMERGIND